MVSGLVIGETAIVEGVLLYHGVTLGGTGEDCGKRHPTVRKGALISAHAQVIGPSGNRWRKVGAAAVVVADVPSDACDVVGIPADVRVHGQKDEPTITKSKEKQYYVMSYRKGMPVKPADLCSTLWGFVEDIYMIIARNKG